MTENVPVWAELFVEYANNLDEYWPKSRSIQITKFEKSLAKIQAEFKAGSREEVLQKIISFAETRKTNRPVTVFLISAGSSGSHWLEGVLQSAAGMISCGEVYLPPSMMTKLKALGVLDRSLFLDCIHLTHASSLPQDSEKAVFINSAHLSGWRLARFMGPPKKTIFLKRHPAKIVTSRSFRKPAYRKLYGSQMSLEEFVDHNIDFVNKFFEVSLKNNPDSTVSFEEMRTDLIEVLNKIQQDLGVQFSEPDVSKTLEEYGYVGSNDKKDNVKTNVYSGPKLEIPEKLSDKIGTKMKSLSTTLGYETL
ncbi:sulfotransferase domain-containing protein [Litorimonas haliclonae]|uniref:sulfotransferase domain-containing protein n=1 Tax=Litorimonas haliclonae TaxID=2081977 RepID=UPI0039EFAC7F